MARVAWANVSPATNLSANRLAMPLCSAMSCSSLLLDIVRNVFRITCAFLLFEGV